MIDRWVCQLWATGSFLTQMGRAMDALPEVATTTPGGDSPQRRPFLVDEFDLVRNVVGDVGQQLLQRDRPGLGVNALSLEIFRLQGSQNSRCS